MVAHTVPLRAVAAGAIDTVGEDGDLATLDVVEREVDAGVTCDGEVDAERPRGGVGGDGAEAELGDALERLALDGAEGGVGAGGGGGDEAVPVRLTRRHGAIDDDGEGALVRGITGDGVPGPDGVVGALEGERGEGDVGIELPPDAQAIVVGDGVEVGDEGGGWRIEDERRVAIVRAGVATPSSASTRNRRCRRVRRRCWCPERSASTGRSRYWRR